MTEREKVQGKPVFAVNAVNSKFGWAREADEHGNPTSSARPIVLRSYKDKRKAKNRAAAAARRKNRK